MSRAARQILLPLQSDDLGPGQHRDVGVSLEPIDEVARHPGVQVRSPDHHRHLAPLLGQEHGGLSGRVATAHDQDRVARALARLEVGRRVVHALGLELGKSVHVQAPIAGAAGRDDRPGRQVRAVGKLDDEVAGLLAQGHGRAGGGQRGTELLGLDESALGEVAPRDTGGEAEVVLDPRAGPRLATRGDHVHADRAQALRRTVDGGGETGGSPADDDQVHAPLRQAADGETQVLGERTGAGPAQDLAGGDDDGQLRRLDVKLLEQGLHLGVGVGVEPEVGQPGPRQELADLQGLWRVARADHPRRRPGAGDEDIAPRHEGREDLVTQVGLSGDDFAEGVRRHREHLSGLRDACADEHAQTGEQVQLAEEPPAIVGGDDAFVPVRLEQDLHLSREHDVEVVAAVPRSVEVVTGLHLSARAHRLERGELGSVEGRKRIDREVGHRASRDATGTPKRSW